ncbi:MAG: universal stress protein, partial [Dinghuibacter sp.]|nr:universal stress protein [Dinghuibacter sp.]
MKTILVATDFSSAAENAAKYAADMAAVLGARLYLLNVYNIPASYSDVPLALNASDMMQEAEKNLMRLKDKLDERVRNHVPMETEVRMGLFLSELKETCERIKPYLVVLGSQGTTATERFFFGSHAVHAMQQLSWPLLTVPPEARFSAIKRIGLATDLEKVVDLVPADALKTLVNDFRAELHILHTGKSSRFDPETVFESGLLQEMIGDLKPEYHF